MNLVLAAGGAAWEPRALAVLEGLPALTLARRCVDVADLLSAAQAELADVAVVAADLPGLDLDVVDRLRRAGLRVVAVTDGDPALAERLGLGPTLAVDELHRVADLAPGEPLTEPDEAPLVAIWGPTGAPGRSAVALSVASALAARGVDTVLVDADVEGGAQAQALGLLDDVSGLVSAVRAANQGRPDDAVAAALVVEPHLRLLTGLPRADMASQLRPAAYDAVLTALVRAAGCVVVDCGFSLDAERGGRGATTVATLERADVVVVVGRSDPLGLSRLVRALHDLASVAPGRSPRVLVNHARRSLGWSDREVSATITRLTGVAPDMHLPFDQAAWDAAAIAGRTPRTAAPTSSFVARVEAFSASLVTKAVAAG